MYFFYNPFLPRYVFVKWNIILVFFPDIIWWRRNYEIKKWLFWQLV